MSGEKGSRFARSLSAGLVLLLILQTVGVLALDAGAQGTPEPSPATPIASATTYAWVQLGPDGIVLARAITDGDCPTATIDEQPLPMSLRAPNAGETFPVSVCEATVPPGTATLTVGDRPLPLLVEAPRRIAVIGDTGCRLKSEAGYHEYQSCNDPSQWPFAEVARQVAAFQPDLIIHVGDYVYREAPCPPDNGGCAGSPWGDNWETWDVDFFGPASPLLPAAPWIFVRGNHEICSRSGEGWFRFLDPRDYPESCLEFTDPYAIDLGIERLVVLDSSAAGDETTTEEETAAFRRQFAEVSELAGDSAWLVSHKPVWGIIENSDGKQIEVDTDTFEAATDDTLAPEIKLVVSGHIHLAEILDFVDGSGRPTQLIVGNSGTALDKNVTATLTGSQLKDKELAFAETIERFGFVTLEAIDAGWVATVRDVDGLRGTSCLLISKSAACTVVHRE